MRHTPCGCRSAYVSAVFSNLRLLWILSDLQVPTRAALLRSPRCSHYRKKVITPHSRSDSRAAAGSRSTPNRLATPMAASAAMPPRRDSHSPGVVLLRDRDCQCNFLWVGLREGYLFLKKRYPSLAQRPFKARRTHRTQWGVITLTALTVALTHAVSAQKSTPSVGGPKGCFFSKDTVRYLTERRC